MTSTRSPPPTRRHWGLDCDLIDDMEHMSRAGGISARRTWPSQATKPFVSRAVRALEQIGLELEVLATVIADGGRAALQPGRRARARRSPSVRWCVAASG